MMLLVGALGLLVVAALAWRFASRRYMLPCPTVLAWLLESRLARPLMDATRTLRALDVHPGMVVLDAGCGAGRVTLPLAGAVGEAGRVVALDVQAKMLSKVEARAREAGVTNVVTRRARLGSGAIAPMAFDRAALVTVLGEVPDPVGALRELGGALKPGGLLAVTEVFPDPHYCSRGRVARLGEAAGLRLVRVEGPWFAHTSVFSAGTLHSRK